VAEASTVDLCVVGGGINGVGIARDAAGRGLSVVLCEQDDLASATSSWSTKLIHGGLRYLEHYEFRLVRESLIEREVLLRAAPHIIRPMRFLLPHSPEQRPAWLIRIGLFLYDHLGGRERLPGSRRLDLRREPPEQPLRPEFTTAFEYSDCWVDDARLVVLNAIDATERGAEILTRTRCVGARRAEGLWRVDLESADGGRRTVRARALANAAGPWVDRMLRTVSGIRSERRVRLVKGSHIVVPRVWPGEEAFILQNDDKRIVFVIPYEDDFSLIGTTDVAYEGDPAAPAIDEDEIAYLLRAVNRYLRRPLRADEIVWSYAGVRPLHDDSAADVSAVTRDYVFDVDTTDGAPLLSVFGGKLTTYRKLAEHALGRLAPLLGNRAAPWTGKAVLPGGDLPEPDQAAFAERLRREHPWLPLALAQRWARSYGTRVARIVEGARSLADLGSEVAPGLHEAELDYMRSAEWARTAEDVLWRRSKLGLHGGQAAAPAVQAWLDRAGHAGDASAIGLGSHARPLAARATGS
jgi:glycerol-3-phosphate dehydrogenase